MAVTDAARPATGLGSEACSVDAVPIDADRQYSLGGNVYAGHQLLRAIHCAHSVARACEIAATANGGLDHVDQRDFADAQREATEAMGAAAMLQITAEACEYNGLAPVDDSLTDVGYATDPIDLLTAAENAEACAEGWSHFTHFGERIELRLERIDCPDAGEATLPDDVAAWQRVWARTTPLHVKVIEMLKKNSPAEYARIEAYFSGQEARHAAA